jgi:hypothetical protein
VAGGVLDGHIRPCARDDDRLDPEAAQEDVEPGLVEAVHAHLLDHVIALGGLEAVGGGRAPRAAHERVGLAHALEQRGVLLESGRAGLDDVPDVDDRHAGVATLRGEGRDVGDDALCGGVRGGPRVGERAALDHHVVLQVLDDQRGALRVEAEGLVGHSGHLM